MTETIRLLAPDEHRLIGGIIGRAFADDPVNLWVFKSPAAMPGAFTALARHTYLKHGFGLVTEGGTAGTLWLPPHAQKGGGLLLDLALARAMLPRGGIKSLIRGTALGNFMARNKPAEPHYYLFAIGVDPSAQGKGLGSKLMRATLAKADAEGMPAYLENSKPGNIPFYMGHGFEILEEVTPVPGCPPVWRMWRKPA